MGKCSVCGKKILYNEYKVVKGIVYCLNCKVGKTSAEKLEIVVNTEKLNFDELKKAMEEPGEVVATPIEKVVEEIQQYGIVGFTEKPKKTVKRRKKSKKRAKRQ